MCAKIQDAWKPIPDKVSSCLDGGIVYIVQPAGGFRSTKAVHRAELFDSKKLVPTTENPAMISYDDQDSEPTSPVSSTHSHASSSSDSDSEFTVYVAGHVTDN